MIHIPNRTGVEPVNGAVLRWREMAQLMHPHNKTTKGSHTHTHTHTPKTCSQIRPSLVPLRDVAELPLPGRQKPKLIVNSGTQASF